MNKIELRGVSKAFGDKVVLDELDLAVETGTSMVIVGGSGTGKSVTLKTILGLITPDEGQILIDGHDVTALRPAQRSALLDQFGMLFQGGALFDSLSIWENVAFRLIHTQKLSRSRARMIAIEKLESVGLGRAVADLYPAELSGGMQKRVSLARAIAAEPKIIFFDEPTTGLDPIMADVINNLIVECVKELGATTLTITHDMASVRKIADHVSMLYEGKIIWTGPVEDLDSSGNAYVDQFIHGRAEGPIAKHAQYSAEEKKHA